MKYLLFYLLPKNLISRLAGYLADIKLPSPLLLSVIRIYSGFYRIKLSDMKIPANQMNTFNEFFTRELKPELRPIDPKPNSIVSPVDGTIAEFGPIQHNLLIQTKGIHYSLNDLVGDELAQRFENGFFVTIYLSPSDYHRIHSPIKGKVAFFNYFSGNLWPVNQFGVNQIGGLFALNERIVTPIEGDFGTIGLVKVGATVVGKIKVRFSDVTSNTGKKTQLSLPIDPPQMFDKGEEIGKFQLGSTVILLFEEHQASLDNLQRGFKIRMGEEIGLLTK